VDFLTERERPRCRPLDAERALELFRFLPFLGPAEAER